MNDGYGHISLVFQVLLCVKCFINSYSKKMEVSRKDWINKVVLILLFYFIYYFHPSKT